jgi:anhydro-N-acetylmuramic acid kinase
MPSPFERSYRKNKLRKILVVAAGGDMSGVQSLYFLSHDDIWEIISHASIPYPDRIGSLIESFRRQGAAMADLGWLEYKITMLLTESAHAALARVPRALRKPDVAVVNQLSLWKGPTGENEPLSQWNIALGDPLVLARALDAPVVSDLTRYRLLAGNEAFSPTFHGNLLIARPFSGIVVFVNIGLVAHITIIDKPAGRCLLDADTGPGMCLINRCAREINCPSGFDRDGSEAAKGNVDIACLDALATSPWFLKEGAKEASSELFDSLLQKPPLMALAPSDRLATLTALTARTIYDFFRTGYKEPPPPEVVLLSGGGVNNLSLVKYLSTYFGHIPLKTSDELGIPLEMRIPLAMGLSVDGFLRGAIEREPGGKIGSGGAIGRVTMP